LSCLERTVGLLLLAFGFLFKRTWASFFELSCSKLALWGFEDSFSLSAPRGNTPGRRGGKDYKSLKSLFGAGSFGRAGLGEGEGEIFGFLESFGSFFGTGRQATEKNLFFFWPKEKGIEDEIQRKIH
jgi:hypothetical protein